MSRPTMSRDATMLCFPRVSGDEPAVAAQIKPGKEFSPRERG